MKHAVNISVTNPKLISLRSLVQSGLDARLKNLAPDLQFNLVAGRIHHDVLVRQPRRARARARGRVLTRLRRGARAGWWPASSRAQTWRAAPAPINLLARIRDMKLN